MQENEADRERRLRELASKLLFTIERRGSRFALYRDVDVPKPVRHDDLTLDEVEDILNTWKLRGPHGWLNHRIAGRLAPPRRRK
jgi:hypothetical protein